jgi:hypothetical protein
MQNDPQSDSLNTFSDLRELGVVFARMVAALAVDPHGYFEKKYTARIESAESDTEIRGVLAQLVLWTTSSALSDENRATLDNKLQQLGLPSVAELRLQFLP